MFINSMLHSLESALINSLPSFIGEKKNKRIKVELPVTNGCKEELTRLGVTWPKLIKSNASIVEAELPLGWTIHQNCIPPFKCINSNRINPDYINVTLIDDKRDPIAVIWMTTLSSQRHAFIDYLPPTQVKKLRHEYATEAKLSHQFQRLIKNFKVAPEEPKGCLSFFRTTKEQEWEKIKDFVLKHPEFKKQLFSKKLTQDKLKHSGFDKSIYTSKRNVLLEADLNPNLKAKIFLSSIDLI